MRIVDLEMDLGAGDGLEDLDAGYAGQVRISGEILAEKDGGNGEEDGGVRFEDDDGGESGVIESGLDYEAIRRSYMPEKVRVLLVGESRPVSGHFFYTVDKWTNYTQKAFSEIYEEAQVLRGKEFLAFFQAKGFYLEDLAEEPLNDLRESERNALCRAGVPALAAKLAEWRPQAVIAGLKKIESFVQDAVIRARVETEFFTVPYAGNGSQNRYVRELTEILRGLREKGVIS